jgi:formate dehydrogenase subunit gamma
MAQKPETGQTIDQDGTECFIRFAPKQRAEHILLIVTFTVLAVTGLAQRYYTAGWGEWVILHLGGIESARLVHRGFAAIFILSVIYHFGYLGFAIFARHARLSMVPTLQDFRDVTRLVRYSLGFSGQAPRFGRFDYRQKFEYWGLIFGSTIIIVTGLILMFPVAVTRILPGQFVAASVAVHGYEATLAVLTIVFWHLYDVILKPGIFPADTSIFTGKISARRLLEEHPLEFEELTAGRSAAPDAAEKPGA